MNTSFAARPFIQLHRTKIQIRRSYDIKHFNNIKLAPKIQVAAYVDQADDTMMIIKESAILILKNGMPI
jgi:hypothetical protein